MSFKVLIIFIFAFYLKFITCNQYSDKIYESNEYDFIDEINSVSHNKENIMITTKGGLNAILSEGKIQDIKNDFTQSSSNNLTYNLDKSNIFNY